jgi:O-antigen/teichoic acid export membrane protein
MLYSFLEGMRAHTTNFVIAILARPSIAGLYLWGFQVAGQAIVLLTMNMVHVFFPALVKLNDRPEDQSALFIRATRALTLVVGLVAVLQATLVEPGIRWLFDDRWLGSAAVVRWMSVAMIFLPLNVAGTSVLLARGAFRRLAAINVAQTATVAVAAGLTAPTENLVTIAAGVSIAQMIAYAMPAAWVLFGDPAAARAFARDLARPWVVTGLAAIVGAGFAWQSEGWTPAVTIAVGLPALLAAWLAIVACVWPEALVQARRYVGRRVPRRLPVGRRPTEAVR